MFKNTDKIGEAIDLLIKVTQKTADDTRKTKMLNVILLLSELQDEYYSDL